MVDCLKAYLKHRNSQSVKDREAYLREKARTEKARAQKLELENALREGQQVNVEDVAREMRDQHSSVKRRLLILPQPSSQAGTG